MKVKTAIKELRELHECQIETGNTKSAEALSVAINTLEKTQPLPKSLSVTAGDIATVDTALLRDISELSALRAPVEASDRRILRHKVLSILDKAAQ